MENSVNALQMAAGLLLGVLILSALVYVFNVISNSESARDDKELVQQTTEFNKKFLAFNRTSMYGTDLISVLSLAISNNQVCNAEKQANPDGHYDDTLSGSLNIKFTLLTDLTNKTETIYQKLDKDKNGNYNWVDDPTKPNDPPKTNILLNKGIQYQLDSKKLGILTDIATKGNESHTEEHRSGSYRTLTTTDNTGFNQLKQRVFECKEVEYDDVGRIYSMTFQEKKVE